jgi:ERCC4-related helicase
VLCRPFIGQGSSSKRDGAKKGGKKGEQAAAGSGGGAAAAAAAGAAALAELGELAGGMKQKEQQQVLQAYRDGKFNVLLATCIGEEGLDIPQVEELLCYLGRVFLFSFSLVTCVAWNCAEGRLSETSVFAVCMCCCSR